ncbi:MAG: hypothetical protein U9Q80_01400 [Bacillota bacterium]|nr:hypothetical protein [Bacillota bacterium]
MINTKVNIIIRSILTNLPYYILLILVYGKNIILLSEILLFTVFMILLELKFADKRKNDATYIRSCLEILDQYLRIGFSPSKAYEKMLITQETSHIVFKNVINDTSYHASKILEFLKEDFAFNYKVFKKQTYIVLREIESYESMKIIYRKNLFEVETMKHLPLIILLLILKNQDCNTVVYSISLILLFVVNVFNLYFIRNLT